MWTLEKIAMAAKLWSEDKNGPDIASALGVTVKQLYGLSDRRRDLFPPRSRGGIRKKVNRLTVNSPISKLLDSDHKSVNVSYPPKAFGEPGIPAAMLVHGCCNFPLWGHHEAFDYKRSLYCGGYVGDRAKGTYCEFHAEVAADAGNPARIAAMAAYVREAVAA
jgi:hypothetical protein